MTYDIGVDAQFRMVAETPPNADRFTRAARNYAHHSHRLRGRKRQQRLAKTAISAPQANRAAG